jgi:hypothetical protein
MMDPLRFFQVTGIGECNILVFRDPYKAGYQKGISADYPNPDGIVEFIRHEVARWFPHVTEVLCVGTSSGGLPAIYCGLQLKARAIWCFGGRVCKPNAVAERDAEIRAFVRRCLGREPPAVIGAMSLTQSERAMLRQGLSVAKEQQLFWRLNDDPDTIIDHAALRAVIKLKNDRRNYTMLHLYYSPDNAADAFVARSFEGLCNVRLHPVECAPDASAISLTGSSTHIVAKRLDEQGRLGEVFRGYLSTASGGGPRQEAGDGL